MDRKCECVWVGEGRVGEGASLSFVQTVLVVLVVLVRVIDFNGTCPRLGANVLSFVVPAFLVVANCLIGVRGAKERVKGCLGYLTLPCVVVIAKFSILSCCVPIESNVARLSLSRVNRGVFVASVNPC